MKDKRIWIRRVVSAMLLSVLLLTFSAPAFAKVGQTYYSTVRGLRIHSTAQSGTTNVVGKLNYHRKCTHLSTRNGWWRVRTGSGVVGYVWPTYLRPTKSSSASFHKNGTCQATKTVTVRKAPRSVSSKVGTLSKGKRVRLTAIQGSWGKVRNSSGGSGWVPLSALKPVN